jgi:hypothetical protein
VISTVTASSALILTGTGFKGISEASGGGTNNSATNYPLVHIQSIANDQALFLTPDPNTPFTDTSFASEPIVSFPNGYARVTVFVNGSPSISKIVLIAGPGTDTIPPIITLAGPNPQTIEAHTGSHYMDPGFTATDDVDGDLAAKVIVSGTVEEARVGTYVLTYSVTDSSGNVTQVFRIVNVVDTTPPKLTIPGNITIEATSTVGAVVLFTASAIDLVDGNVPIICNPPFGSTFTLGTTTVNCSAKDAAGNIAMGSFTVTVRDTTRPVIVSAVASPSTLWPPNHKLVPIAISVRVSDTVDPAPSCQIVAVACNEAVHAPGQGNTNPDWLITGALTLSVRSERSGAETDRNYSITIKCMDASGNSATKIVTVTVQHDKSGK